MSTERELFIKLLPRGCFYEDWNPKCHPPYNLTSNAKLILEEYDKLTLSDESPDTKTLNKMLNPGQ